MYRSKSHCGLRKQVEIKTIPEQPELNINIDLNTKNSEQTIFKYLENQKQETTLFQLRKRKIINANKRTEIFQLKQSMSHGESQHPSFFQNSIKLQDYFDNFKILKFPHDPIINTFDNSKRFLKELSIVNKQDYFSNLKSNQFKHYKGKHWTHLNNNPSYFGQFKSIPHEESPKHNINQEPIFKTTFVNKPLFSDVEGNKVHLIIPFNDIHDVKYHYGNGNIRRFNKPKTSLLNERQVAKPFLPISTRSGFFSNNFLERQQYPNEKISAKETFTTYDFSASQK